MVNAVPVLLFNFNFNFITLLKFLNCFQTFNSAHDPAVPEGYLQTGHASINQDLEVLAPVPVIVGRVDDSSH